MPRHFPRGHLLGHLLDLERLQIHELRRLRHHLKRIERATLLAIGIVRADTCVCVCVCVCGCVCVCVCVCVYIYIIYIYIYIYIYRAGTCIYIFMCVCVCLYMAFYVLEPSQTRGNGHAESLNPKP